MSSFTWVRGAFGPTGVINFQATWLLAQLTAGQTLTRVRFGWGFGGQTSRAVVFPLTMANPLTFGLVTVIGTGTPSEVPDPYSASSDQSPPAQRWIWWEQRWPHVDAYDAAADVALWSAGQPAYVTDTHAQVKAPVMGAGQTLDVWATFRTLYPWDVSGQAFAFGAFATLIRNP